MTLRTRLLIVLVGIVLVGLLVSGIVTYKSLESFLVSRLDQQLQNSPQQADRALGQCIAQGSLQCTTTDPPSVPAGTFGQLRAGNGQTYSAWFLLTSSTQPPPPVLPADPPVSTSQNPVIFTAVSSSGLTYRAIAEDVNPIGPAFVPGVLVVAVPLTEVDQTLSRLLLVELLVSGGVLIMLGAVAWWIVKAGLRPLDEMATTAGAIAAGDLTQRVPTGDAGTEVGRLGMALNAMLGEIEESFAARKASEDRLRRFLADASHELRTPLTSIRGYAEMFDRGTRDRPEDLAMSMRHIRQDADRMSSLVEDLLVLARLDRERPLAHEQVDLRPVLESAVADVSVREPDRSVELEAPEPAIVAGDADRLRQVVDNLLVNAVRHTPSGTPIEVDLRHDGGSAVIGVRDHGPGIPPEERSRIFEPFYRSDPSRSRATGGEGLGLAIVETIVRAHGGQVGVGAPEGEGARFWVRIPLAQQVAQVGDDSAVEAASSPTAAANGSAPGIAKGDDAPQGAPGSGTVPVVGPTSDAEVGGKQT
ncbi:MAG: sensor histidine kinase [Acidimicrobiales bacterium]